MSKYGRIEVRKGVRPKKLYATTILFLLVGTLIGGIIGTQIDTKKIQSHAVVKKDLKVYGEVTKSTPMPSAPPIVAPSVKFHPLQCTLDDDTQEFVYYLCKSYDIDFKFVMAMIQVESGGNANAVSSTGDYGLMQIHKANKGWLMKALNINDILDPEQNVRAGAFVLKVLFDKYKDPNKVLMAYNMGESDAKSLWKGGVYETDYTRKVIKVTKSWKLK